MKLFQYFMISLFFSLGVAGVCAGDEEYCENQYRQGSACGEGQERTYFYDRYQPVYYDACCPYYHKEYGECRSPHWPGKIYEPFHQQLMR